MLCDRSDKQIFGNKVQTNTCWSGEHVPLAWNILLLISERPAPCVKAKGAARVLFVGGGGLS